MAFALTKFKAYVENIQSPNRRKKVQRAELYITSANTDTALDIGTYAGTFWTAAKANATYGTMATNALADIQNIVAQANVMDHIGGTIAGYDLNLGQRYDYYKYDSAVGTGSAAKETMTVTGLLSTDTVLAVTQKTKGATQRKKIFTYTSAAGAGGGASEALTVTGLLASDTVLSVTQVTPGATTANSPLIGWSTLNNNTITAIYLAAPGAGSVVEVMVERTVTDAGYSPVVSWTNQQNGSVDVYWQDIPGANAVVEVLVQRASSVTGSQYAMTISNKLPVITFISGSAPTTNYLEIQWELADGMDGINIDYGA